MDQDNNNFTETFTCKALDRVASLGDCYDANTDRFTGDSIFRSKYFKTLNQTNIKDSSSKTSPYVVIDSISDKFRLLGIEGSTRLRILSGFVDLGIVGSSGSFLYNSHSSKKSATGAIIYSFRTKKEKLNYFDLNISYRDKKYLSDIIKQTNCTHFVTGVGWGANVIATFTFEANDESNLREIKDTLDNKVFESISKLQESGQNTDSLTSQQTSLKVKVFSDFASYDPSTPTNVQDFAKYVLNIPNLLKGTNNGKGVPIEFELTSIDKLKRLHNIEIASNILVKRVTSDIADYLERIYVELDNAFDELNDNVLKIKEKGEYFSDTFILDLERKQTEYQNSKKECNEEIRNIIQLFVKNKCIAERFKNVDLNKLLEDLTKLNINTKSLIIEKNHLLDTCTRNKTQYFPKNYNFDEFYEIEGLKLVFCYNSRSLTESAGNNDYNNSFNDKKRLFLKIIISENRKNENNIKSYILDLDLNDKRKLGLSHKDENKVVMVLYDGIDLLTEINQINELNEEISKKRERDNYAISDFKCINTINNTEGSVHSFLLMSNNRFASGLSQGRIKIWNSITYECIKTLTDHSDVVDCMIYLSYEKFASCSRDKTIKIWNSYSYECIKTLNGHSDEVYSLAALPNDRLASGSKDKTIKIWNLNTFECITTLTGHTNSVCSLLSLPNARFASGSGDKTIKIWNSNTLECIHTLNGHNNTVYRLILLSKNRIASSSSDHTIKIWNLANFNCIATLTGHTDYVWSLICLSNDRFASGSADKTIKIWDANSFQCIKTLTGHTGAVYCLLSLPDDRLVSGSFDITIKIWSPT
jgi:WD40 repeat protein